MLLNLRTTFFSIGLICLIGTINTAISQNLSNQHWYFGNNNIAVEFSRPNNIPILIDNHKTAPFNVKGNATANKPETGDLLFYTDGLNVYDVTYSTMDGISLADKLDADINKNQSVAIAGFPNDNNLYYIFTNTPTGAIHFSTVDMNANGNALLSQPPLGSISLPLNQSILNSTANASDALLVVANANNDGYWLITLDKSSNNYKVLGLNSNPPSSWLESTYALGASMNAAHFAFNADSSKIAVAPKSPNVNIQLLNIDLTTGILTFDKQILNSGNSDFATEAVFDVEFSNDGSKLYYSRYGDQTAANTGNLMQVDLVDTTIVLSPQPVLPTAVFGSYGIQLGPDGNLYHLYQETNGGPFLIGSLTNTDSVASITSYTPAIENGQNFNSFQFPAFLPVRNPQLTVDFTFSGTCANAPTAFFPSITPAPTNVLWDFGDGNTSNDLAPFNTYTAGGTMTVTLTALLNGQPTQVSKQVDITDFQLQLTLPTDTVACQCELPKYNPTCTLFSVTVQAQNDPGATYVWSTGETGMTLHPDSAGYYYVVATDPISGCSTYAGVQVQEYDTSIPGIVADQRANIWYFGQNAGIDFNLSPAVALTDGAMDAMEGCTAVSDRNGQIIFYTDGNLLYDKSHSQINTTPLGGTPNVIGPAAQSVIAVNVPGDETLFYIFTTQSTDPTSPDYEFSYSLYDLKSNTVSARSILFSKSTERITATNNWVVIHEYGNNNFRAYPISASGIGNAVVSSIGEDYSMISAENGKGYMKLNGSRLGLAVIENNGGATTNFLDVFDFNAANGEVSNLHRANLSAAGANGSAYGIEFSGSKIFVSINNGSSSQIMEYWFDVNDSLNLISPIMATGVEVGAIQTGPDGQVYVAQNGSGSLGTITVGGDSATASIYNADLFNLAGKNSQLGLPNFIQQLGTAGTSVGISVSSPACFGQLIYMSATVSSSIDEVIWEIRNPNGDLIYTSTLLMDSVVIDNILPNTPGVYTAALSVNNRCFINDGLPPILPPPAFFTINAPPQISDLPVATFLCGTSTTLPVYTTPPANMADLDFAWSTGETTSSITVTAQGTYDVLITDRTSGCATNATTFVGPPFLVDLGLDQTICENDPLNLDSQVNADSYVWTINGVPQSGTRFFDFGALNLGGGNHTVQVDATIDLGGSIGPCTITDQVIITINPAPVFNAIEGGPASCGSPDGSINLTLVSIGSYFYDVAGQTGTIQDTDAMPVNIAGIPAGVNFITLTNNVTGCTQIENVAVTNPTTFNIDAATANDETCINGDGSIDYTVSGIVAAFTATVRDLNNPTLTYSAPSETGTGTFSVSNIPAGDYSIELLETATGCIEIWIGNPATNPPVAQTLTIGTPTDSDLTISNNPILECGTSIDLSSFVGSITPGVTLEWSIDNFTTSNPITTAFTTLGSTNVSFRASSTVGPPATCEVIQTADVILTPTPTLIITPDNTNICNGLVTLTANGDGGYPTANIGYRWSTGETTQSITVSSTGSYTATIFHTINQSCLASAVESVTIPIPFTVALTSTLACDNGQPFTVTATPNGQTNNNLSYTWFLNNQDLGLTTSSIVGLNEGLYEVVAEDIGGCTTNATLIINRIALTPTNLSSAPVFCPDDGPITLDVGPNFASYLWSDGSKEQQIEVFNGGLYEIAATNTFGCVTNDQSEVVEDCIPKVSGPNAFRPGGLNSTYSLFTEYIDNFEIFIYNRWGELVYHSTDKNFAWNGTSNGGLLPAGQYSWVVRYTSSFRNRGTVEEYGGVTLLR